VDELELQPLSFHLIMIMMEPQARISLMNAYLRSYQYGHRIQPNLVADYYAYFLVNFISQKSLTYTLRIRSTISAIFALNIHEIQYPGPGKLWNTYGIGLALESSNFVKKSDLHHIHPNRARERIQIL